MPSIYHYCSTDTFHKIILSETLRLSSMSLSNDSEEGVFAVKVLESSYNSAAVEVNRLEAKKFQAQIPRDGGGLFGLGGGRSLRVSIYPELDAIRLSNDGLGLCMSSDGDMLSQWRGYADDGHGVSIGFSRDVMTKWTDEISTSDYPIDLIQVIYDQRTAAANLKVLVAAILKHVEDGALDKNWLGLLMLPTDPEAIEREKKTARLRQAFDDLVVPAVVRELYRYKNPAFAEEKEWRLLTTFQPEKMPPQFAVHPTRSTLKPYLALPIKDHKKSLVNEVIMGPKNTTPAAIMEAFLQANGYVNARVRRSNSTYR